MRLPRGSELLGNADVELVRSGAEPDATAGGEERWLLELVQPQEPPVEAPRVVLAPRRRCDLDVVEADDHQTHRGRPDAPRDPGPGKANPLLQVGALPTAGDTLGRTRAPFV